jgi:CRISPR-associated protein Cmr3
MSAGAGLHLAIRPIDTLMFRDGRPFNQGDPGAAEAVSVFPPFPPTVVGMVRAMLARGMGWEGGAWPTHITEALGDGVDWQAQDALGPLAISAALVCQDGKPLYPAPRSILAAGDNRYVRLVPAPPQPTLACDLGKVRLPTPERQGDGLKELNGKWITGAGLQAVLHGGVPDDAEFVDQDKLWRPEARVGVGIDMAGVGSDGVPISKLAERRPVDGALYAATHTRLRPNVSLAVKVTGAPQGAALAKAQLSAAGGEHRMAEFSRLESEQAPKVPDAPQRLNGGGATVRYVVYHASPCLISPLPHAQASLDAALPGTVVSACLGKAQPIGGWDSQGRRPIPMRPAIPAGSVWFLEAPAAADILKLHGGAIGAAQAWGFGQIYIGTW